MALNCGPTEFKTRFPEFSTITDPRIQIFIDDSTLLIVEATWGTLYSLAVCYLTAHYLALAEQSSNGDSGSVGNVASQAVDGTSISFNNPVMSSASQAFYNSTSYGQRFYSLIRSLGVGAATV